MKKSGTILENIDYELEVKKKSIVINFDTSKVSDTVDNFTADMGVRPGTTIAEMEARANDEGFIIDTFKRYSVI